jgi:hypothetical protein
MASTEGNLDFGHFGFPVINQADERKGKIKNVEVKPDDIGEDSITYNYTLSENTMEEFPKPRCNPQNLFQDDENSKDGGYSQPRKRGRNDKHWDSIETDSTRDHSSSNSFKELLSSENSFTELLNEDSPCKMQKVLTVILRTEIVKYIRIRNYEIIKIPKNSQMLVRSRKKDEWIEKKFKKTQKNHSIFGDPTDGEVPYIQESPD